MLKDKLNEMKAVAAQKIPPETMAIMLRSRVALGETGILAGTIKPGERFPDFTLNDAQGKPVSLAGLRSKGPVLISLYRGVW